MASLSQGLPLIKSKISLPRRQPSLLRRERLVGYLHEHIHNKLILVSAGAGYGKTSLLVDYCHDTELPVCWYALDRNDCHIFTFIEYLVAAIRQRYPEFGASVLQAMHTFEGPEEAVEPFVRLLIAEIEENVQDYFVLVLDDFHHVSDSATVNALLDGLLLWLPEHCHVILASRGIPRRLTLTRLARDQAVMGVGVELLAFTGEEIHTLLHSLGYDGVDLDLAEELAERSEGWITGVLLAAQSDMAASQGLLASSLASRGVFEFMATEILERQPDEVQDFMLGTSLLREMSAPLCDALLGIDNSALLLLNLSEDNLFISSTDAGGNWYQYHQLYREFLLSRLETHWPQRYHDLCVTHADLMVNQGHWPEAIAAYLDAQAYAKAAEAIEIAAAETIDAGNRSRVRDWIDTLPSATMNKHPRLLVHRGHIAAEMGEPVEAIEFLEQARLVYDALEDPQGAAHAIIRMAFPQRSRGRYQDAIQACQTALAMVGDRDSRVALMAHSQTSICHGLMGDLDASLSEMRLALDIARRTGDDVNAAFAVTDMGNIEINRGNTAEAKRHLHQALLYWRKIGNQAALSSALQGLGMLHLQLGQYADANVRLSQSLDSAEAARDVRLLAYGLANMGDLSKDTGRYSEALASYEQGIERAYASQSTHLILYMQVARAEALALQALNGEPKATYDAETNLSAAEQLIEETLDQVDADEMRQETASAHMAMALVWLARAQEERAERQARLAAESLAATDYARDRGRALVLSAAIALRTQSSPCADDLRQVAEIISRLSSDQFVTAYGPVVAPLLERLQVEPIQGIDAAKIRSDIDALFAPPMSSPVLHLESKSVPLELLALDGGIVLKRGEIVTSWEADAARLLAFLLAASPQGLERDQLTERLWPEVSLSRGSSRCYTALHRLKNALGKDVVVRHSRAYRLNPDIAYRHDVDEFTRLAQLSSGENGASHFARQQAIALYKSDYLGSCDLAWCDDNRHTLRVTMTRLLHQEAQYLLQEDDAEASLALYTRLQVMDPLDERTHRGIMRCRGAFGDVSGVARAWEICQRVLADELGVEPSSETRALAMRLVFGGDDSPN